MSVESFTNNVAFITNKSISIEPSLKRIIEKEGFIEYKVNKRCVSANNGNFLGILYHVDIKGKTKNGKKELNIFMKTKTLEEETVKIISIPNIYKTETYAYNELFKIYEKLQKEANVPFKKRYKTIKSYEDNTGEAIILDNIAIKDFNTYYRMDVASYNYVEKCVTELAKFHGLSFVLEERYPKYFYEKVKPLKISYVYTKENVWESFVESVKNLTMDYVDEEYKDKVEKKIKDVVRKYLDYYNDETTNICLCHGDYRPSNIMVKYENNEEKEIIPVDYQLIHYGCPIFDILYFIYFSTDREFRKNHMTDIKNLYYNSLQEFLAYFDLNAEAVYPREEFEKAFKEKVDFGLMVSLLYLCYMFVTENCVKDMENISFQIDGRFEKRLRDIIEEFMDLGFI